MAKKKKTRHQKIITDSRRQAFAIKPEKTSEVLIVKESAKVEKEEKSLGKYSYLSSDLKKTAIATSFIFAFQIIFFFLLTRNIIEIPGLNY